MKTVIANARTTVGGVAKEVVDSSNKSLADRLRRKEIGIKIKVTNDVDNNIFDAIVNINNLENGESVKVIINKDCLNIEDIELVDWDGNIYNQESIYDIHNKIGCVKEYNINIMCEAFTSEYLEVLLGSEFIGLAVLYTLERKLRKEANI